MNTKNDDPLTPPPQIADEVRALLLRKRLEMGLSQTAIGEKLRVAYGTVYKIETGRGGIPKNRVAKFMEVYDLSKEALMLLVSKGCGPPVGTVKHPAHSMAATLDIMPLIKAIAEGGREELTVGEWNRLVEEYASAKRTSDTCPTETRTVFAGLFTVTK